MKGSFTWFPNDSRQFPLNPVYSQVRRAAVSFTSDMNAVLNGAHQQRLNESGNVYLVDIGQYRERLVVFGIELRPNVFAFQTQRSTALCNTTRSADEVLRGMGLRPVLPSCRASWVGSPKDQPSEPLS